MLDADSQLWKKLLLIALVGAIGTLARYGLSGLVQRVVPSSFPWGTLAVNGLGCLAFGLVWAMAEERMLISGTTRLILLVGFMGAFTTFSTYAFETARLLEESEWLWAVANLLAQNVGGVALVLVGMSLGRLL